MSQSQDEVNVIHHVPDYNKSPKIRDKMTYLVSVEDPSIKNGLNYYQVTNPSNIDKQPSFVHLKKCFQLSSVQAKKARNEKTAIEIEADKEMSIEIPWSRIIRIEHVTYKNNTKK